MAAVSTVKIENAAFSYGDHLVFKDITLETKRGEIFCIMGKNGCGKSTLLDCILGFHTLDTGSLLVSGKAVSTYKPLELAKQMAYLPQSYDRSFPYKVRQVVLMGRTAYMGHFGSPSSEDKHLVNKLMAQIGIDHLAERPYTTLSGGELQMVMLARALAQESPLILMDEPTAHLDYYNELLFLETIAELVHTGNRSIFMATHSPNQAFYLESKGIPVRVGLMWQGQLFESGTPKAVLTPQNLRRVYSIDAQIIETQDMRQVVPIKTLKEK